MRKTPSNLRHIIITRLNDHLDELQSFVDGLPEDQLWERPDPENWSMGEIILHLVEVQDIYVSWITQMIMEENPRIIRFCADQHPLRDVDKDRFHHQVRDFAEQRVNLVSLLDALDDRQWVREAIHPTIKHFSVEKCMEGLMRHEECHLYDLYKIFFETAS